MAQAITTPSESPTPAAPADDGQPAWHTLAVGDALARLASGPSGLPNDEAAERLKRHGPNELQAVRRESAWRVLAAQFQNALIVILLCATLVSGFLGHALEAAVISVIVLLAVLLGFLQEYRASRALDALRRMAAPAAHVVRDGHEAAIPAREVVPGDVVVLRAGDRVPADCRIVQSVALAIDEAALTGESEPVRKTTDSLADPRLSVGDRLNMAYAGTLVTHGRGRGLVVSTGMATEFGQIARMVDTVVGSRTPLQDNLDRLGATLGKAALAVVALIVGIGLFRGQPVIEMFMFGIALAVAVVPEALPAVVTISLAIGVRRMVRRQALVRRLPVVETLGSTSVICSDKTGTLTKNEMTVRQLFVDSAIVEVTGAGYDTRGEFVAGGRPAEPSEGVRALLRAAALSSDARVIDSADRTRIEGDPTEGALVVAAMKAGLNPDELNRREPRVDEIAFTSERRRMTTLHETAAGVVAYSKGAAEEIVAGCGHRRIGNRTVPLDDEAREEVRAVEQHMASAGLRVLAVAVRTPATPENAEAGMTLLGLVGMMDPPRRDAIDAVQMCRTAGIQVVMVTGDHPLTAMAVARELRLPGGRPAVTGRALEEKREADLDREVADIAVYARVSPADKLRIVRAWQRRGAVVAMTGDGINDAPALKQADVGIAMGITGTDVSKEAAGMTLLDDNFATIVAAVEEGRIVFGNIKKYLMYLLSCNVGEIVLLAGAVIAGLPMPLTAVQILYVNLATDGLPALALSVDPPERDVMQQRPRDARAGIFTTPVTAMLLTAGLWSAAVIIFLFTSQLRAGRPLQEAMAMTFVALVLIQFFNAYCCRSEHASVADRPFTNRWLNLAVVWELALLVAIAYIPFFQRAFGTFALTAADWLLTAGLAFSIVPVLEVVKAITRRRA